MHGYPLVCNQPTIDLSERVVELKSSFNDTSVLISYVYPYPSALCFTGPGWYACAASGAKPELYGVVKAPFDSNAPRKWTFLATHLDTPGPGDYSAREVKCCPQSEPREAYVFRSRTCRFRKMKSEVSGDFNFTTLSSVDLSCD